VIYNLYLVQIVEGECQEQLSPQFHSIGTGYVLVEDMCPPNHSITPQRGGHLKLLKKYHITGILLSLSKATFPPQELSPGTRNFGVVLGVFTPQEPGSK